MDLREFRYILWTKLLAWSRRPVSRDSLTETQRLFCEWNAERLGIALEESTQRYLHSLAVLPGTVQGPEFRIFNELAHELFRPFVDDTPDEIFEAYRLHAHHHFMMMLGEPPWKPSAALVDAIGDANELVIVDFGCGLAHRTRGLVKHLRERGQGARLVLVDIPTVRKPFLLWLGERLGLDVRFLDCTEEHPLPALPDCDVCFATEVFEHLHDPLPAMENIHVALRKGGLLQTNVRDHDQEFMHVTPQLDVLRHWLSENGYSAIVPNRLYRKPE